MQEPAENVVSASENLDQARDMGDSQEIIDADVATVSTGDLATEVPDSIDAGSGKIDIGAADEDGVTPISVDHPPFDGEKHVRVTAGDTALGSWHFSGKDTPKTVLVDVPEGVEVKVSVTSGDTVIAER